MSKNQPIPLNDAIDRLVKSMQDNFQQGDEKTSSDPIIDYLSPYLPGLYVIAGRPGSGVSSVLESIILKSDFSSTVLICVTDGLVEHFVARLISAHANIPLDRILKSQMSECEWASFLGSVSYIQDKLNIHIVGAHGLNANQIHELCLGFTKDQEISAVVIDNFQNIATEKPVHTYSKMEDARVLKCVSTELQVPVIVTSLLGKELENRPNKRPCASDITSLNQYMDIALSTYRVAMYRDNFIDDSFADNIEVNIVKDVFKNPLPSLRDGFSGFKTFM